MQISLEQAYQHGYQDGLHDQWPCLHADDNDPEIRSQYMMGLMDGIILRDQGEY